MSKLKCVECPYSEYNEWFGELWCTRKVRQVNWDDTCDKNEDGEKHDCFLLAVIILILLRIMANMGMTV